MIPSTTLTLSLKLHYLIFLWQKSVELCIQVLISQRITTQICISPSSLVNEMLPLHRNEHVDTGFLNEGQPAINCLLTPLPLPAGKAPCLWFSSKVLHCSSLTSHSVMNVLKTRNNTKYTQAGTRQHGVQWRCYIGHWFVHFTAVYFQTQRRPNDAQALKEQRRMEFVPERAKSHWS